MTAKKLLLSYSFWAIAIYAVVVFTYRDSKQFYKEDYRVIQYDMGGYYRYLQAFFLHGDYTFNAYDGRPHQVGPVYVENTAGEKVALNKYSVGPAILCAPFFLIGHAEAYYQQVPRDGFSYTYLFWIITGCAIYGILALFLLRSVLLRFFEDEVVAATLVILSLGTIWLYYTAYMPIMSHAYSAFLFSLALFLAFKWYGNGKWYWMMALSLTAGLIAVTRLPNMVYFSVLAFIGVYDKKSLWKRLTFFLQRWWQIVLGLIVFLIPFIPQVAYWYHITGHYYVNAYYANEEYFYWVQPLIGEVLIGYRKGWLIYSPLILLALIGFGSLRKQYLSLYPSTLFYIIVNVYIISCWSCWWYGGCFGMRPLVESSIVLVFPLAAILRTIYKSRLRKYIANFIILFFILLNHLQSHQAQYHLIHYDSMTREAYWHAFGVFPPVSDEFMEEHNKLLRAPSFEETRRKVYPQTIW